MRLASAAVLSLVLAGAAAANPTIHDTFCLDMGDGSSCVWPDSGEVFTVTVYLAGTDVWFGGWGYDVASVAFRLERTFGGQVVGQVNLLGGVMQGSPETAWRLYDDEGCAEPGPSGVLPLAEVSYLYQGTPGTLRLRESYTSGLRIVDCVGGVHWIDETYLGFHRYGGVGVESPWGCYPTSVEPVSWGAIKALYR